MTDDPRQTLTARLPTPDAPAHADICIPFEIAGMHLEAVGFLKVGQESCLGEEAIRRTDNGHLVKSEEDRRLLIRFESKLPAALRKYVLVTARPYPANPRFVSHLYFVCGAWVCDWSDLGVQWRRGVLVVRRRVSSPA